jgi:hypothetical protein
MDTPAPVDISRLKGILGNAKKLMNKVESGDYETGHVDARALNEEGIQQMQNEGVTKPQQMQAPNVSAISPERIAQSKMPEAIKRAMLENPIPQATMGHTFSLDDVTDFAKDEKPLPFPKANPVKKAAMPISENRIQGMVGLTEAEVRVIVKDEMIEFLTKYFTKSLTEDVQKKVIRQLLESGKIKVKS